MSKELVRQETTIINGAKVRVIINDDDIKFVAKDVVEGVGAVWKGSASISHIPDDFRGVTSVQTPSGIQQMTVLTEAGVNMYLFRSDMPAAIPFQRVLASEIIPSIRKYGVYATPVTIESMLADPDFAIQTFQKLKEERLLRIEAEQKAEASRKELEVAQPTLEFHKHLTINKVNMRISAFAKILTGDGIQIGPKQLLEFMRSIGLMQKKGTEPIQKAINDGLMDLEPILINNKWIYKPVITPSGCQFILSKITRKCDIDDLL